MPHSAGAAATRAGEGATTAAAAGAGPQRAAAPLQRADVQRGQDEQARPLGNLGHPEPEQAGLPDSDFV